MLPCKLLSILVVLLLLHIYIYICIHNAVIAAAACATVNKIGNGVHCKDAHAVAAVGRFIIIIHRGLGFVAAFSSASNNLP